ELSSLPCHLFWINIEICAAGNGVIHLTGQKDPSCDQIHLPYLIISPFYRFKRHLAYDPLSSRNGKDISFITLIRHAGIFFLPKRKIPAHGKTCLKSRKKQSFVVFYGFRKESLFPLKYRFLLKT